MNSAVVASIMCVVNQLKIPNGRKMELGHLEGVLMDLEQCAPEATQAYSSESLPRRASRKGNRAQHELLAGRPQVSFAERN